MERSGANPVKNQVFTSKLLEVEEEYALLRRRLRQCQGQCREEICRERQLLEAQLMENRRSLEQRVTSCRSPAVAALAKVQLDHQRQLDALLQGELPQDLRCEADTPQEDRAEAAALFAEYAMDFAAQSTDYALLAALKAVELQLALEEESEERKAAHNE